MYREAVRQTKYITFVESSNCRGQVHRAAATIHAFLIYTTLHLFDLSIGHKLFSSHRQFVSTTKYSIIAIFMNWSILWVKLYEHFTTNDSILFFVNYLDAINDENDIYWIFCFIKFVEGTQCSTLKCQRWHTHFLLQ